MRRGNEVRNGGQECKLLKKKGVPGPVQIGPALRRVRQKDLQTKSQLGMSGTQL